MRVVVLGYHDVGCACLDVLLDEGHDVVAVYTHRDDPAEDRWFGSVADLALARGIPVHRPDDINAPRWIETIRDQRPEVLFSFYYRKMVRSEITSIPPRGALNLHGSLLPRFRGRCPVNWVLVEGERETGVTLHHMIDRPDAGDIVSQRRIPIGLEDTALSLHREVVGTARELLRDVLPSIRDGTAPSIPQDPRASSTYGARRPEDGRIDWDRPAIEIHNLVRAVSSPWPGAFTFLGGRKLFIWESWPEPGPRRRLARGAVSTTGGFTVGTSDGVLRVRRCQLEGESVRDGDGFARRLATGTVLG